MTSSRSGLAVLLSRTWAIYRAQLAVVLVVAGGVVAVVDLILGAGLGQLAAGYRAAAPRGEQAVTLAAAWFVTLPLVSVMLARVVLDAVGGERPSARRAIRTGLDLFAPVLLVTLIWSVALVAGLLLLIVPAVYIAVSWYFVAQAVVLDDRRGLAAIARSGELVRGRWFSAALTGLSFQLAILIPQALAAVAFDEAARALDATAVLVAGDILVQTFSLPFVAIGATLFYLDLRAAPSPPARPPAS